MAKIVWTIQYYDGAFTDITNKVLSASIDFGRTQYTDSYSGGRAVITINNASNYASNLIYGKTIAISNAGGYACNFLIERVDFDDYPGNTGLNTATITAVDSLCLVGRGVVSSSITPPTNTVQAALTAIDRTGARTDITTGVVGASEIVEPSLPINGLACLNQLVATERTFLFCYSSYIYFASRNSMPSKSSTLSYGRTGSSTVIGYSSIRRVQNGQTFFNVATISPQSVASQTSTNTVSKDAYGPAFYSASTLDLTTTQALSNAQWLSNTFSDPATLRYEITFKDVSNSITPLNALSAFWSGSLGSYTAFNSTDVTYQVPGGSPVTVECLMEGGQINITPELTEFNLFMSPMTYYQYFTLNSSTLGILDTSRLGW